MCGRFYVDEGTAREIEQVIRGVDLRIQKMRTGDIYPSQSAGILTCHSQQKNPFRQVLQRKIHRHWNLQKCTGDSRSIRRKGF